MSMPAFKNSNLTMNKKTTLRRCLSYLLIALLTTSNTCVVVKDEKNRDEEIDNTASSLGEHLLWRKIRKTKEVIDSTYHLIHALQDSLDRAKQLVHTVTRLGMTSLSEELLALYDMKSDVEAYVNLPALHPYAATLNGLYRNDATIASQELGNMLCLTEPLPHDVAGLNELLTARSSFRTYYSEFSDKRALQVAQSYRKWAKVYRQKGTELSRSVLRDKELTMTDLERIKVQRIAQQYVVMSYEFLEKSDSILLSVQEKPDPLKYQEHRLLTQYQQLNDYFDE